MDDFMDFMNFQKPFKRETISAGYLNGRTIKLENDHSVSVSTNTKREAVGTDYVREFREREQAELTRVRSPFRRSHTSHIRSCSFAGIRRTAARLQQQRTSADR